MQDIAPMTPEERDVIDRWSLEDLLSLWRFSEPGNKWLQGERGEYFSKRMFGMRDADNAAWVRASK